jgi:hypothetical protein
MKDWPWYMWVLFIAIFAIIGLIFAYIFFLYHTVGFLHFYVVGLLAFIAFMVIHTKRMAAKGYHLHIHHYFLGMIVMAFTCYQNTFLTIVSAIFNGISIEGGSRWGYDAIWLIDEEVTPPTDGNVTIAKSEYLPQCVGSNVSINISQS